MENLDKRVPYLDPKREGALIRRRAICIRVLIDFGYGLDRAMQVSKLIMKYYPLGDNTKQLLFLLEVSLHEKKCTVGFSR